MLKTIEMQSVPFGSIDDLIKALERVRSTYGDLAVTCFSGRGLHVAVRSDDSLEDYSHNGKKIDTYIDIF